MSDAVIAYSSPKSLLPCQFHFKITPFVRNPSSATLNFSITYLKRCRIRAASSLSTTSNYISQFNLPDNIPDASDADPSPSLPRPLSSSSVLNSDGPRLRVAYQGVSGAYSELAAETAYPNCEPVPCDQFETAFEVPKSFETALDTTQDMHKTLGIGNRLRENGLDYLPSVRRKKSLLGNQKP